MTNKNLYPSPFFGLLSVQQVGTSRTEFSLHASVAHFLSFQKRSRIERESIEIPTSKHCNAGVRTNF